MLKQTFFFHTCMDNPVFFNRLLRFARPLAVYPSSHPFIIRTERLLRLSSSSAYGFPRGGLTSTSMHCAFSPILLTMPFPAASWPSNIPHCISYLGLYPQCPMNACTRSGIHD